MTKENSLSIDDMRRERHSFESTYMEFVGNRKYHNMYAFCFYEGEDGKYYDFRIRQKFGESFLTYPVGNKKEVLKLLYKLRENGLYDNVCTMFFVDRDYDSSLSGTDKDLYETPCYSIENLYAKKDVLSRVLQSEFGLNVVDEDYQKCVQDFCQREIEFNDCLLEYNALAYLRRQKSGSNSNFSFGTVKTSNMVNVQVGKIEKASKYADTIKNIKEKLQVQEDELEGAKEKLVTNGNYSDNFRGKNQLDFFVEFIRDLKKLNSVGDYFSVIHNNIRIDITNNRLSELSQYAITPVDLDAFLEEHKKKYDMILAAS